MEGMKGRVGMERRLGKKGTVDKREGRDDEVIYKCVPDGVA